MNVSSETWFVDTAGNVEVKTASTVNSNFDEFGRAQTTTYLDGSTVTRTYGCCGVETETDRDGVVTTYAYDDFKRVSYTVRDGITTLYSYDALGNQTAVTIKGRNDGEITTESAYSNGELCQYLTDMLGKGWIIQHCRGNFLFFQRRSLPKARLLTATTECTQRNPIGDEQVDEYIQIALRKKRL